MSAAEPLLLFRGLHKTYSTPAGPLAVLRGVDLALWPGEFAEIRGASGAGKSTLLNIAALLDSPTAGSARFVGRDVAGLDDDALCALRKQAVGMVFQGHHLLPHRTVLDNVLLRFRYVDLPRAEALRAAWVALARVGLAARADHPARLLSGGEAQRAAIARAIALPPRLLVADEPTGNLDPASADAVRRCLDELNATGITVLLVSHARAEFAARVRRFECRDGRLHECAA